jgi:hypothetical protein
MAVRLSGLRAGRALLPSARKIFWCTFMLETDWTSGYSVARRITYIEKIHSPHSRIRDVQACSIVTYPLKSARRMKVRANRPPSSPAYHFMLHLVTCEALTSHLDRTVSDLAAFRSTPQLNISKAEVSPHDIRKKVICCLTGNSLHLLQNHKPDYIRRLGLTEDVPPFF